jgi:predicted Zn-dependent peptidase
MFWKSSSYHWDIVGWPSDLGCITREQADAYFDTYYAPNNLVMILVGDLEPDKMINLVKKYFERIPRGKTDPPDVTTLEEKQYGEKRMIAEAEASPQAQLWYHTVAWKHPDSYPLEVLAGIMKGKTGRLFKKLVDEKGLAKSSGGGGRSMMGGDDLAVDAFQGTLKYEGFYVLSAEGISGVKAEQLEEAMYEVINDLMTNPVTEEELQKVKNQLMVQKIRFMDIMSGIGVLFYLGENSAYGDWTEANNGLKKLQAVSADDVQRVANKYFADDQRNVLIINSKTGAGDVEAEASEDDHFNQMVEMVNSMTEASKLQQMIGMVSMQLDKIEDPQEKEMMEKLLGVANKKLAELKAAEEN